ncbi:MAG: ABC transporter substrate-binding protein [Saprospiraceae bacterium]
MGRNLFFFFFLLSISLLIQCKTEHTQEDDTIHIRIEKDPERLHPLVFPNPSAREIYQYIFLPLAGFNRETLLLEPLLITTIPEKKMVIDGPYTGSIKYDIEIKPEAVWEDGSPITSKDYIFTLKSILLPLNNTARYRDVLQNILHVESNPTDLKKFSVYVKDIGMNTLESCVQWEIYPAYFYDRNDILGSLDLHRLISDTLYTQTIIQDTTFVNFASAYNGLEFSSQKISGSGPYSFSTWETNQYIVLEKKKKYWGEKSNIGALKSNPDKIVFHIIADDVAAMMQLKEGKIDIMNQVSDDDFLALQKDINFVDKFHFFTPSLTKYYVILLNNSNPKLKDKKVRRALAHLVDVDYILNNLENGFGQRLNSPVHPTKPYYNKNLAQIKLDLKKSASLLEEAGWKDTNEDGVVDKMIDEQRVEMILDIYVSGQELGNQVSLLLQQNAAKVGIKINIIEKEFKLVRSENIKTRQYHLVPSIVSTDLQHWDDLTSRYHSDYDNPRGANDVSYLNPMADSLLTLIPLESDLKKREALYQQLQKIIYDDQPMIYLYVPQERIVLNKIWEGNATMKRPGYAVNEFLLLGKRAPQ